MQGSYSRHSLKLHNVHYHALSLVRCTPMPTEPTPNKTRLRHCAEFGDLTFPQLCRENLLFCCFVSFFYYPSPTRLYALLLTFAFFDMFV